MDEDEVEYSTCMKHEIVSETIWNDNEKWKATTNNNMKRCEKNACKLTWLMKQETKKLNFVKLEVST